MTDAGRTYDPTDFYHNDLSALPQADRKSLPQPTLSEVWRAGVNLATDDRSNSERDRIATAYRPILEVLNEGRPSRFWATDADDRHAYANPGQWGPAAETGGTERDQEEALIWREIARRRAADPKFLPDVPATLDEFHDQVRGTAVTRRATARDVLDRNSGLVGNMVSFAGGALKSLDDPLSLATLPIGGAGKTIAQRILIEGLANAAAEAVQQPTLAKRRSDLGERLTVGEAATNVAAAGAVGSMLQGAAIEPATALLSRFRAQVGARATPAETAAAHIVERDEEVAASSPFRAGADTEEHVARLETARAVINGTAPVVPSPRRSAAPALSQNQIIRFVLNDLEGGSKVVAYNAADGGTTKWGVAAKHNPGVDVANLTEGQAADIARRKYWFRGLDAADPRTAAVAFDAGYISGPDVGRRILRDSGGDPARAIELYRAHLDHIADSVPGKARYRKGWSNRVDKLARLVDAAPDSGPHLRPEMFGDEAELVAAQTALREQDAVLERVRAEANAEFADAGRAGRPVEALTETFDRPATDVDGFDERPLGGDRDLAAPPTGETPTASIQSDASASAVALVRQAESSITYAGEQSARQNVADVPDISESVRGAPVPTVREAAPSLAGVVKPAAPKDLLRFLAEHGGIADGEGHDLMRGRNLQTFIPGKGNLIRKGGMSMDAARELAAEAGYFHHLPPDRAFGETTPADFLNLLEDAKASKRFALGDLEEVARREFDQAWKADQEMRAAFEADSSLARFDDPIAGTGPRSMMESLEHDLRMDMAVDPDVTMRLSDEGGDVLVRDVLDDLEADAGALSAARRCMSPAGRAA